MVCQRPRPERSSDSSCALGHERVAKAPAPPVTPDGRYIVVRGRLWRRANPHLSEETRVALVRDLMTARRAVGVAKRGDDPDGESVAHGDVDAAKRALGERGPVWWMDGAPDFNRHMAKNTPYADWWAEQPPA